VLSRVTTVLPFVPFTLEEKKAICSEALYSLGGEDARSLSVQTVEDVIRDALENYCPIEGARSLHRAISNQLIEII
jgi:ATP-dependent Clp protease ATP-binding subunit ClpA